MLSLTKTFTALPPTHNLRPFRPPRHVPFHMSLGSSTSDNGNNSITSTTTRSTSNGNNVASGGQGSIDDASPPAQPLRITPPDTVEIRFKRGSRKRRKQEEQEQADKMQSNKGLSSRKQDWDSMTLTEKLVELYVGEKGMLFWLNKFAYASIFIVIGGWILFRFVGPALNMYQLDTPPLAPTSMFK